MIIQKSNRPTLTVNRTRAEQELSKSKTRVSVAQYEDQSSQLRQSHADVSYAKQSNYSNQSKTKDSFYPVQTKKKNEPLERSLLREKSKEKLDQNSTKFIYEEKRYTVKDGEYTKAGSSHSSQIGHQLAQYFKEQKANYRASEHDVLRDKSQNRLQEENVPRRSVSKKAVPADQTVKNAKTYFAPSKQDHAQLAENIPSYFNHKKKYSEYAQQITNENMYGQKVTIGNGGLTRNKSIGRSQGR